MSAPISHLASTQPLILASGSAYRAELLGRLRIPFVSIVSSVDEAPIPGEAPAALAHRLARAKAQVVAAKHPKQWVLGSDQVCACGGRLFGKPGTRAAAIEQLSLLSGQQAMFLTAVALVNQDQCLEHLDITTVQFRPLSLASIERYVDAEPSFDCAGSFKSEGLGIRLLASIDSQDPTGLIGLPLIAVSRLLIEAGFELL